MSGNSIGFGEDIMIFELSLHMLSKALLHNQACTEWSSQIIIAIYDRGTLMKNKSNAERFFKSFLKYFHSALSDQVSSK